MNIFNNKTDVLLFLTILIPLLLPLSVLAYPEGQLYWATENYPEQTYNYDPSATYEGALGPLDYACQQNSGSGTYTGEVMIDNSANNFPAQKGGWCMNHHPYVGDIQGNYYTAYLYCNGVQRDMFDDTTPCEPPAPEVSPDKNLGQPEPDCH